MKFNIFRSEKENGYFSEIYQDKYKKSIENPEEFWAEIGKSVHWHKKWDKVLDNSQPPFTKWYPRILIRKK